LDCWGGKRLLPNRARFVGLGIPCNLLLLFRRWNVQWVRTGRHILHHKGGKRCLEYLPAPTLLQHRNDARTNFVEWPRFDGQGTGFWPWPVWSA
jgi:hypothetical protein